MLRSAPAATPVDAITANTTSTNVSTLWIEFEPAHQSGDNVSGSTPVEPEHVLLPNLLQIAKEYLQRRQERLYNAQRRCGRRHKCNDGLNASSKITKNMLNAFSLRLDIFKISIYSIYSSHSAGVQSPPILGWGTPPRDINEVCRVVNRDGRYCICPYLAF